MSKCGNCGKELNKDNICNDCEGTIRERQESK